MVAHRDWSYLGAARIDDRIKLDFLLLREALRAGTSAPQLLSIAQKNLRLPRIRLYVISPDHLSSGHRRGVARTL